jgi:HK97 family phage major capsid protein
MRRATLLTIGELLDTTNRPLFDINARDDQGRPLLLGYPVFLSPSAGAVSTGSVSVLFGDMGAFLFRRLYDSLAIKILIERFALSAQITFLTWMRCSGAVLKSSTGPAPIKHILHA